MYDKALKDNDRSIELANTEHYAFFKASSYDAKSVILFNQGKFDRAILELDKAIDTLPKKTKKNSFNFKIAHCHLHRGICKVPKKEYKEAIKDFTDAIKTFDDNGVEGLLEIEKVLKPEYLIFFESFIDIREFKEEYDKLMKIINAYIMAHYCRSQVYLTLKKYSSGIDDLKFILNQISDKGLIWFAIADVYYEKFHNSLMLGNAKSIDLKEINIDIKEAIIAYEKVIKIVPDFAFAYKRLSDCCIKSQSQEKENAEKYNKIYEQLIEEQKNKKPR